MTHVRPIRFRVSSRIAGFGLVSDRLDGGNAGGAVRVGDTVRRATGPWTPAVHTLLAHLEARGFAGAPRALGADADGHEVLTFLPGRTVGSARPWPTWVHAEETLDQVARWLRSYHDAVADFVPPADAMWRDGEVWTPGWIVARAQADGIRAKATDPLFAKMVAQGVADNLDHAAADLDDYAGWAL